MKKFLAILLAMMLVMVSVAAMAADGDPIPNPDATTTTQTTTDPGFSQLTGDAKIIPTPTEATSFKITKNYSITGTNAKNASDTLTFTVTKGAIEKATAGTTFPADHTTGSNDGGIYIDAVTVTPTDTDQKYDVTIHLPTYTAVGVYNYTVTETNSNVAGVGYYEDTLYLKVTVVQDTTTAAKRLLIGGIAIRDSGDSGTTDKDHGKKIDEVNNTYDAGTLTVSKVVDGNLGNKDNTWNFTVVFTAPQNAAEEGETATYQKVTSVLTKQKTGDTKATDIAWGTGNTHTETFTLKHGENMVFQNIPKGVTYVITETEAGQDDYVTTYKVNSGSKTDYDTNVSGDIATNEDDAVEITNTKDATIDTGITLETLPYVLMMALAMMGLVALKLRKREEY